MISSRRSIYPLPALLQAKLRRYITSIYISVSKANIQGRTLLVLLTTPKPHYSTSIDRIEWQLGPFYQRRDSKPQTEK